MRITSVSLHKVNIPLEEPTLWIGGVNTSWTRTILRMQTDEGIEGIAETGGSDGTFAQLQALSHHFVGEDPYDRERILLSLWYLPMSDGISGKQAVQALETACWDIIGKASGQPLYQLLGGKKRSAIPTIAYLFYRPRTGEPRCLQRDHEELIERARTLREKHGLTTLKLKGGVFLPDEEYESLRALREAFPDAALRFDPNALWTVPTALRMARRLEELDLEWLEDPVSGIEGMSRSRRDIRIPFATNMCCVQFDQLAGAIRAGAMDIQLLDVHDWGGISVTMKAAAACEAFQVGVGLHSSGEAGISTALYLHIAASLPSLPFAIDSLYHQQTDDVVTSPHVYVDGTLAVPEGNGLGVEIDEERLKHLEAAHRREGDRPFFNQLEGGLRPRYPGMV